MSVAPFLLLLFATKAASTFSAPNESAALLGFLSTRLGTPQSDCEATCNGEVPSEAEGPMYECWGDFDVTCDSESEDSASHSNFKCKGFFAALAHKNMDALITSVNLPKALQLTGHDENDQVTYISCEGQSSSFSKTVHHSDHSHREDKDTVDSNLPSLRQHKAQHVLQSENKSEGTLGVIHSTVCSGVLKFLMINVTEGALGGASYEPAYVTIDGYKRFPQGTAASSIFQQMDGVRGDVERQAYRAFQSVRALPVPLAWHLEEQQQPNDSKGQSKTLGNNGGEAVDVQQGSRVRDDATCSSTCNGKPTSWGGLWPCWGEMKYTCTGCGIADIAEGVCYKTEGTCEGFGWAAFMSCKGTYLDHTFVTERQSTVGTEVDGEVNSMHHQDAHDSGNVKYQSEVLQLQLTTGFRKATALNKDGWEMMVQGANGHSADRFNVKWASKGRNDEKRSNSKQRGNIFVFGSPALALRDVDYF